MAMSRSSSSLSYPERFYAAAAYAGFAGSKNSPPSGKFQNDVALLLYGLYQQATVGQCNVAKPRAWNPVEHSKWTSWNGLGNMASTEAMRLFVKILEEEDPSWYSKVPEITLEPLVDVKMHNPKVESTFEPPLSNGNSIEEPKTILKEDGIMPESEDKDVIVEGLGTVGIYDEWIAPSVSGQLPRPRYEHGAALVQDKMYIFGGNHNGRYLNELHVLDLKRLAWSKVEAKAVIESLNSTHAAIAPCAGHSLISWGNKILCLAGHTKDPSETVTVKEFDPQTCTWSNLKTYGKSPISRGGQSVTLVGDALVMFGGEDAKRSLLNDLHILDLETMTWDDMDAVGTPPSPRSDHAAACHAGRYLLIFGGGSHAIIFNDLHVLDLQTMEWSTPNQQGILPGPRAGHAGVTVGENWYIVGGGDSKNGVSETLVLNMSTLVWSVVTSVEGRVPLASEGLSLVSTTYNGEDFIVSFGGYNGRYNNEVNVLKPSHKSDMQSKIARPVSDGNATLNMTTDTGRDLPPEAETAQDGRIREIVKDNVDVKNLNGVKEESSSRFVTALEKEKEELELALNRERLQCLRLKQELAEVEPRNTELMKELQSVRSQLAAEQSRCFKLEVDLAELRQKLQTMESLEKELELLQRQKAASEQAALSSRHRQGSGVWGWLAGTPPDNSESSAF